MIAGSTAELPYTVENPESRPDHWPGDPDPEIWRGLAGNIAATCAPYTEADPLAMLVQALALLGNQIGRGPHFRADGSRHALNMFVVLVGESARSRKGTSFAQVRELFKQADDTFRKRLQSGLSSGEGLIWAVRDPIYKRTASGAEELTDEGVTDKRLVVHEAEFAKVLRVMSREGSILSAVVREAWDSGDLRVMTKNSPASASGAHISIIGHITQSELRRELTATESANGFGNRFLWLGVRRSKLLPDGGRLPTAFADLLVEEVRRIVAFAHDGGELARDTQATALWRKRYPHLVRSRAGLTGSLTSRAEAHVMRLACLYALSDESTVVREIDLRSALALWDYLEQSGAWVFGDSVGDSKADECLRALRMAGEAGLSRTDLMNHFGRNIPGDRLTQALTVLKAARLIYRTREESKDSGRAAERWYVEDNSGGTKLTN